MTRTRTFVSAFMVLAMLVVLNAPLLACEQSRHKCAMMDHQAAPPSDAVSDDAMAMPEHDCCPRKTSEPSPTSDHKLCHETNAVMPAECATSSNCCEMGNAPVVSVQMATGKKLILAVVASLAADPGPGTRERRESASLERPPRKPVFELKTDLRI